MPYTKKISRIQAQKDQEEPQVIALRTAVDMSDKATVLKTLLEALQRRLGLETRHEERIDTRVQKVRGCEVQYD